MADRKHSKKSPKKSPKGSKKKYDTSRCKIPKVYCGIGDWKTAKNTNNYSYYYKRGSPYECMKSGFGAGMYSEKKKSIPNTSLQNIPYVGPVYDQKFKTKKIKTLQQLVDKLEDKDSNEIDKYLRSIFTKSNKSIDTKALNSTILYLYSEGIRDLPKCDKIKGKDDDD